MFSIKDGLCHCRLVSFLDPVIVAEQVCIFIKFLETPWLIIVVAAAQTNWI